MSKFTIRFDDAPVGTTHVVLRWSVKDRCIKRTKYGKPTSGVYVWDHWHRYTVNSVGAAVTLDHWWTVLFPPKRKRHDEK